MSDLPPDPDDEIPDYGPGSVGWTGPRNGVGTASLAFAIVGILAFWLPVVGLLAAIAAVVLGLIGKRRGNRGEATNRRVATAGLLVGILGVVLGALSTVLVLTNREEIGDLIECNQEADNEAERDACEERYKADLDG